MPHPIDPRTLGAVVAGGAVGALARAALVAPWAEAGSTGPLVWITLAVNVVGSFLLGLAVAAFGTNAPRWRAFVGTGMLGGFTTYSAFAVQSVQLADMPLLALTLVAASVVLGVVGARLGILAGRAARPTAASERDVPE